MSVALGGGYHPAHGLGRLAMVAHERLAHWAQVDKAGLTRHRLHAVARVVQHQPRGS